MEIIPTSGVAGVGSSKSSKSAPAHDATLFYGTDKYIAAYYRRQLSPALAEALLKSGTIRALYLLREPPIGQGPIPRLIRKLFYMVPGDPENLLVSRLETELSYRLTPSIVGKLIQRTLVQKESNPDILVRMIEEQILPRDFGKNLTQQLGEMGFDFKIESVDDAVEAVKGLSRRQAKLKKQGVSKEADSEWGDLQRPITLLSQQINAFKVKPLIEDFLAACRSDSQDSQMYGPWLPYQVLLAFLFLKSNDYRQTLLELWREIPGALTLDNPSIRFMQEDLHTSEPFLNFSMTKKDYNEVRRQIGDEASSNVLDDSDILAALQFEENANPHKKPVLFNQGVQAVTFKLGNSGTTVTSTDCCEASFLNFFIQFRDQLRKKSLARKDFMAFPLQDMSPSDPNVRADWKKFVSNLDGVTYLEEKIVDGKPFRFDLAPRVENFIQIAETMAGLAPIEAPWTEKLFRLGYTYGFDFSTTSLDPNQDPQLPFTIKFGRMDQRSSEGTSKESLAITIDKNHCHARLEHYSLKGEAPLAKLLWERGSRKLDAVALAHFTASHLSCLPPITREMHLEWFRPKEFGEVNVSLPIILGCPFDSFDAIADVVQVILEAQDRDFYPLAVALLYKVKGLDTYQKKRLSSIFSRWTNIGISRWNSIERSTSKGEFEKLGWHFVDELRKGDPKNLIYDRILKYREHSKIGRDLLLIIFEPDLTDFLMGIYFLGTLPENKPPENLSLAADLLLEVKKLTPSDEEALSHNLKHATPDKLSDEQVELFQRLMKHILELLQKTRKQAIDEDNLASLDAFTQDILWYQKWLSQKDRSKAPPKPKKPISPQVYHPQNNRNDSDRPSSWRYNLDHPPGQP